MQGPKGQPPLQGGDSVIHLHWNNLITTHSGLHRMTHHHKGRLGINKARGVRHAEMQQSGSSGVHLFLAAHTLITHQLLLKSWFSHGALGDFITCTAPSHSEISPFILKTSLGGRIIVFTFSIFLHIFLFQQRKAQGELHRELTALHYTYNSTKYS